MLQFTIKWLPVLSVRQMFLAMERLLLNGFVSRIRTLDYAIWKSFDFISTSLICSSILGTSLMSYLGSSTFMTNEDVYVQIWKLTT